jgi:helicase MOV-10
MSPWQQGSATSPSAPLGAMGWFPDVYTTPFVTEHQRAINTMPAAVVKALPPPCIDFQKFIESFIAKGFLGTPHEALPPLPQQIEVPVRNAVERSTLTPVNYGEHFAELLGLEISTLDLTIQSYNLYNVQVTAQDPKNPSQYLFRLSIPGIREDTPLVQLGDLVKLRQIRPVQAMYPAVFTGYEYETFIYGMDKALGYVVLRADGLWVESGGRFNVMFNAQHYRWDGARRAIADIGKSLQHEVGSEPSSAESQGNPSAGAEESPSQKPLPSYFLRRMLFPDQADGVMQHSLTQGALERQWIDKGLNYEQVSQTLHAISALQCAL